MENPILPALVETAEKPTLLRFAEFFTVHIGSPPAMPPGLRPRTAKFPGLAPHDRTHDRKGSVLAIWRSPSENGRKRASGKTNFA